MVIMKQQKNLDVTFGITQFFESRPLGVALNILRTYKNFINYKNLIKIAK